LRAGFVPIVSLIVLESLAGNRSNRLFYTHFSARQAPYHTIAISPAGEGAYVIDGTALAITTSPWRTHLRAWRVSLTEAGGRNERWRPS